MSGGVHLAQEADDAADLKFLGAVQPNSPQ
jgi:hypothetical protein